MSYLDQLQAAVRVEAAKLGVDANRLLGTRLWARVPGHGELRKARAIIVATLDQRWTAHGLQSRPEIASLAYVFGMAERTMRDTLAEGRQLIASGIVAVDRSMTISEIRVVADRLIVACGVPLVKYTLNSKPGEPSRDVRCLAARRFAARSLRYEWECLGLPQRPSIPQIASALELGISNVRDYIRTSEQACDVEAA